MRESKVARLVWGLPAVSAALSAAYVALTILAPPARRDPVPQTALLAVLVVVWVAAGAVILRRLPRHPVGWLLAGGGVSLAVAKAGVAYAAVEGLPGRSWVWWSTNWLDAVFTGSIALVLLVFPDGRLVSGRWRVAVWATVAGMAVAAVGRAVSPPLHQDWVDNPTGLGVPEGSPLYDGGVGWLLIFAGLVAGTVAFTVRYRRSDPEPRRQLKWLVFTAVLAALGFAAVALTLALSGFAEESGAGELLAMAALLAFPINIGIAILRHQLFDIDLAIRRSLGYGVLWVLTAAVYLALAALPGVVVGQRLPLEAAIGLTVLATLVFQPARRAVDRVIGRLVYGERPSEFEVLTRFGETVATAFDVVELAPRVADTVRQGLDLEWARVQLEVGERSGALAQPAGAAGITLDGAADPVLAVPMVHGDERLGLIECGPKREGRFTERDHELLASVSRQAALGVHNARLAAELSSRLDEIHRQASELRASRARIVSAQDTERQRLERDLHDGIQQEVVSLLAQLGLARAQLRRDPAAAEGTLVQLQTQTGQVLRGLRAVVQGIHPPVLVDRGLLEAVEALLARIPIGVEIHADPTLRGIRFAPEVEAAAYYFVSEGLTNALKHAGASRVAVRLAEVGGLLTAEVDDDGVGFVPAAAGGSGLTGLRDRVDAAGGHLTVTSRPGAGCRLSASIPTTPQPPNRRPDAAPGSQAASKPDTRPATRPDLRPGIRTDSRPSSRPDDREIE